ncbi:MAG: cysteine--tRNA ligase [Kiritimatiellae bacterium]|nr:cysteine--tRNA ligase [Kiritimatiellia bacterium]
MQLNFYDTATRTVRPFEPLHEGEARMYTCGPTVYNFAHIGNFRAYVFEDILHRALAFAGYKVTQIMNLTDVDDKTIRGAKAAGIPLKQYTKPYIDAFFEDIKSLGITPAAKYPAATDHIPEMLALIHALFDKGLAYKSDDGSVYFSVAKFAGYGHPAHIDLEGMQGGARVSQDEYDKVAVGDFALWKAHSDDDGDVVWDSPWGPGRPGWHIECSAMSMKYLGETFDIHTGGIDNLFPHHANETAQAEGATGKPFARLWMHCAHLRLNGEKMSKSLGNFYTLRDLFNRGWTGREIRFVLVNGHYRQTLNFTFDALAAARSALSRIDAFTQRLAEAKGTDAVSIGEPSRPVGAVLQTAPATAASKALEAFSAALTDDLNTPNALAALFGLVRDGNAALDAAAPGEAAAIAVPIEAALRRMDEVLAFIYVGKPAAEEAIPAEVQSLLDARAAARTAKDWAASDQLRDQLKGMGWEVKDTKQGQKVQKL